MKLGRNQFKAPLSFLLALSLVTAFTLSSYAAPETPVDKVLPVLGSIPALQEPTGLLTAHSHVTINGNDASTGATVLPGNVITTGTGAEAQIEMGPLGKAALEQTTTVTLDMMANEVNASLNRCGAVTLTVPTGVKGTITILQKADVGVFSERKEVDIKVYRGEVVVKFTDGKEKTLKAGDHKEYKEATLVTSDGDAIFKVYCDEDHPFALFFLPLAGLLFLVGDDGNVIPAGPPVLSPLAP